MSPRSVHWTDRPPKVQATTPRDPVKSAAFAHQWGVRHFVQAGVLSIGAASSHEIRHDRPAEPMLSAALNQPCYSARAMAREADRPRQHRMPLASRLLTPEVQIITLGKFRGFAASIGPR